MSEPVYTLDDPRPVAAEAPYTFFLPSPEELAALAPGDFAKLIFRPATPSKWGAERMWVRIGRIDGDRLEGTLENAPEDLPGLHLGDLVRFDRHHVVACDWADERASEPPPPPDRREYWERCFVDRCLLEQEMQVHHLYREPAETVDEEDEYEDSGWRIRADYRGLGDEEIEDRALAYVALGAVLNVDDSWLHLIDAPVGAAVTRDWENGGFVPESRNVRGTASVWCYYS